MGLRVMAVLECDARQPVGKEFEQNQNWRRVMCMHSTPS